MYIKISVVIATHNRSQYLKNALQSLANQSVNKDIYEVIVVDNGSTDSTKELVNGYIQKNLFNLSYLFESTSSANLARNIGWKLAKGNYIAYLDDDAVPVEDWLEKIINAFEDTKLIPGVVGGKVSPVWEGERPNWLGDKLLSALSLIDYSDKPILLTKNKLPFSVNMAFRKELIEKFGGFNLNLGRKGKKLISGDEIDLTLRIRKAGYNVYYDPDIAVDHYIHATRLNQNWFIQRYFWGGYSDALVWKGLNKPSFMQWLKQICYFLYGFFRNPGHILLLMRSEKQPEKFWFKCIIHARAGHLAGLISLHK